MQANLEQTFAKYDGPRLARAFLLCERTNRQSVAQRNGGGETVYVRRGLSAKALAVHIMRPRPRNTIAVDRAGRRPALPFSTTPLLDNIVLNDTRLEISEL